MPAARDIARQCKTDESRCALAKVKAAHKAGLDYWTDYISEQQSWGARTSDELRSHENSLGSLPMTVLTGAKTFADLPDLPEEERIAAQKLWLLMHDHLASLSSRGRNILVVNSGHVIQFEDPGAVTSAIEMMLDQIKSP